MKIRICLFSILSFLLPTPSFCLTKIESYELLQKSDKWRLAETLIPEAQEKAAEIESSMRPRTALVVTEFVARTNPIQYGLQPGQAPITTLGFGTTAIQSEWTLLDPLAKAQLLLYKTKEHLSVDQTIQYQVDLTALMIYQYLSVQKLKRQFDLNEANLKKSELIEKLASAKKSVGAGIPLDVARAKNLVNLDRIKKMAAYTKYLKARHDLQLLLGLEKLPGELDKLEAKTMEFSSYQNVLHEALHTRADLKSARQAIDAAQEAQHYSNKTFFPKLAVVTEIGSTDSSFLGLQGQTLTGFVGLQLKIPLDTGGLIESKRGESRLLVQKTEIGLREKINEVTSQIKESLENIALAEESLKAAQIYVETSEEEARIADQRFNAGSSNGLDLTSAHTNLAAANDNLNESIFNYEVAKVTYFKATGNFQEYFE